MDLLKSLGKELSRIFGKPELNEATEAELDQFLSEQPELSAGPSKETTDTIEKLQADLTSVTEKYDTLATSFEEFKKEQVAKNETFATTENFKELSAKANELKTTSDEVSKQVANLGKTGKLEEPASTATLTPTETSFIKNSKAIRVQ